MNASHFRSMILFISLAIVLAGSPCRAGWICHWNDDCDSTGGSSRAGNPSTGGRIRMNPAAVPVEKGIGGEIIAYDGHYDFSLVKGLGRVGAAISPSNSEETFFGPPGFELPEAYRERKLEGDKYQSSKLTLATAFQLFGNKKSGLKRFNLNLGVMGKYNRETNFVGPGGGLNGILGPFTFGYSVYGDQTQIDYAPYGLTLKPKIGYNVETISAGVFMTSFIFDYSALRMITADVATVNVATATLLLTKAILTASLRTEKSTRPAYNWSTGELRNSETKKEVFGGVQFRPTPKFMFGAFYNYYLLHEISIGATLFW